MVLFCRVHDVRGHLLFIGLFIRRSFIGKQSLFPVFITLIEDWVAPIQGLFAVAMYRAWHANLVPITVWWVIVRDPKPWEGDLRSKIKANERVNRIDPTIL